MFGERENRPMSKKANPAALLPILVFLVLYLGLGLIFEYVLKIPMGFYPSPSSSSSSLRCLWPAARTARCRSTKSSR